MFFSHIDANCRQDRSDKLLIRAEVDRNHPDPCRMDRIADCLLQQGFHAQASRLSHLAVEIREASAR